MAGQGVGGDVLEREGAQFGDLAVVLAGVGEVLAQEDGDVVGAALGQVGENAEELQAAQFGPGFFAGLAAGGGVEPFHAVGPAAGQVPAVLVGVADQQHLSVFDEQNPHPGADRFDERQPQGQEPVKSPPDVSHGG